jgi:hypothetical protein
MQTLAEILKLFAGLIVTLLAAFELMVLDALVTGFGI